MTIRTIALGLPTEADAKWLLPMTATFAQNIDAHLIGIHSIEPLIYPAAYDDMGIAIPALIEWQQNEASLVKDIFDTHIQRTGLRAEFRTQREGALNSTEFMLENMRVADIAVMGRPRKHGAHADRWLHERVIRSLGRPVLLLSEGNGLTSAPRHIVVGWSATREATRALHDVISIAAPGAEIDLLTVHTRVEKDAQSDLLREDMAAALDRHGFKVTVVERHAPARDAGEELQQIAAERGADLVAAGAFGHSKIYDFVIGAVTTALIEDAAIPVLLSK